MLIKSPEKIVKEKKKKILLKADVSLTVHKKIEMPAVIETKLIN